MNPAHNSIGTDAPEFSIIIASYNCAQTIQLTLESIAEKMDANYELVVVDGGSTDGTLDVLSGFSGPIHFISEKDAGIYDALNKGINLASGRFLYFIGAGDTLLPHVLQKVSEQVAGIPPHKDEQALFLYGDVYSESMGRIYGGWSSRYSLCFLNICHQAIFYERTVFERVGVYDLQYPIFADWVFNLRCFGHAQVRIHRLDTIIANYAEAGLSARLDTDFNRDQPKLIRQHFGLRALFYYKLRCKFPKLF
jgi:glycosyltransferase involved in cell wall biosynthesis